MYRPLVRSWNPETKALAGLVPCAGGEGEPVCPRPLPASGGVWATLGLPWLRHIALISTLFAGALPMGLLGPSFPFEENTNHRTRGLPCCGLTLS